MSETKEVIARLPPERREEIRRLLKAGTPGPWAVWKGTNDPRMLSPFYNKQSVWAPESDHIVARTAYLTPEVGEPNAALIVALRNEASALLDAADERDAEAERATRLAADNQKLGSERAELIRQRDALRKERDEARQSEQRAFRMCAVHRQNALDWEKSARALDAALVIATGCEPRYDHGNDDEEEEIAF